jgi:hypothetical protein
MYLTYGLLSAQNHFAAGLFIFDKKDIANKVELLYRTARLHGPVDNARKPANSGAPAAEDLLFSEVDSQEAAFGTEYERILLARRSNPPIGNVIQNPIKHFDNG